MSVTFGRKIKGQKPKNHHFSGRKRKRKRNSVGLYSLPCPQDNDDIFKVMVQRTRFQTTYSENVVLQWRFID